MASKLLMAATSTAMLARCPMVGMELSQHRRQVTLTLNRRLGEGSGGHSDCGD
jgi:hypothetical protein